MGVTYSPSWPTSLPPCNHQCRREVVVQFILFIFFYDFIYFYIYLCIYILIDTRERVIKSIPAVQYIDVVFELFVFRIKNYYSDAAGKASERVKVFGMCGRFCRGSPEIPDRVKYSKADFVTDLFTSVTDTSLLRPHDVRVMISRFSLSVILAVPVICLF